MNSERCWGGLDEQFQVGVDEQDPVVLPLDEQDPQARPGGLWSPRGPPQLSLHTTSSPTSRKQFSIAIFPAFLLPNPRISISLLEAPFLKLFWGSVSWYVTPPFVQLVFALVVYILNN